MNRPVGALSREEVEKLAMVRGSVIYKVYPLGSISKVIVDRFDGENIKSSHLNSRGDYTHTTMCTWFNVLRKRGALFSNYFHALAYSLHLKRGKDENTAKADDVARAQPA